MSGHNVRPMNWQRGYQHHFHWTHHHLHLHLRVTSDPFCLPSTLVLRRLRAFSFRPQPVRAVKSPGLLSRRHVSPSADKPDNNAAEASFYTTRPPSGETAKLPLASEELHSSTSIMCGEVEKFISCGGHSDCSNIMCEVQNSKWQHKQSISIWTMWMCNLQHQTQLIVVIWRFNQTCILMILELETFLHFILFILLCLCSAMIFNKAQRYMLTFRSLMGVKASLHGGLSGSGMSLSSDLCQSSSWEKKVCCLCDKGRAAL